MANTSSTAVGGTIAEDRVLGASDAVRALFGTSYGQIVRFAELLAADGEVRGLIGPREVWRLWERHLINCAGLAKLLPRDGVVADIGSGAGLPGIVVAAMRPDLEVLLVEPMARRIDWLSEVVAALGLGNASTRRARAQELAGTLQVDVVTTRAVASFEKLVAWCLPLVKGRGELLAIKGARASDELAAASGVLRRFPATSAEIVRVTTVPAVPDTVVVRVRRT